MVYILTFIIFIILLSTLIIVHEFGHMYAAIKRGVKVNVFAIGFGKTIYSFNRKNIEYKINILPFGGYVSLLGEDDGDKDVKGSLSAASSISKIIITGAGVVMNFILGIIFLFVFLIIVHFKFYYANIIPNFKFTFGDTQSSIIFSPVLSDKESSMLKNGLKGTYLLYDINGKKLNSFSAVQGYIDSNKGKYINVEYYKINSINLFGMDLSGLMSNRLFVRNKYPSNSGPLGISLSEFSYLNFSTVKSKILSVVTFPYDVLELTFSGMGYLIHQAVITHNGSYITSEVAGPVGIYLYTNLIFRVDGITGIIFIFGIISLSLAIMNLLPIPPLDGFFILLAVLEKFHLKLTHKLYYYLSIFGITFFIILMILVTINDLFNFHLI